MLSSHVTKGRPRNFFMFPKKVLRGNLVEQSSLSMKNCDRVPPHLTLWEDFLGQGLVIWCSKDAKSINKNWDKSEASRAFWDTGQTIGEQVPNQTWWWYTCGAKSISSEERSCLQRPAGPDIGQGPKHPIPLLPWRQSRPFGKDVPKGWDCCAQMWILRSHPHLENHVPWCRPPWSGGRELFDIGHLRRVASKWFILSVC